MRLITKIRRRKDKEENMEYDDVEKIGDGNGKKILNEKNTKDFLTEPNFLSGKMPIPSERFRSHGTHSISLTTHD